MVNAYGMMYFNFCKEERMSLAGFQMADIFTWQVGVWVLIILITGFIGQFGKSFAKYVMSRFSRKKVQETGPSVPVSAEKSSSLAASSGPLSAGNDAKRQKKEGKALLKAKKKEMKQKKKG
ncbi:MAG: hypothetical protein LBV07_06480 [Syntrophobacterales bacterium]|jgi:hypothetical protein|nr:hypothetical protein [Syntrophobacterales bacterium]